MTRSQSTSTSPLAVWIGPRTIGYSFAYAAFVRVSGRTHAASRGATFFYCFASLNGVSP